MRTQFFASLLSLALLRGVVLAHEVDQYDVPADKALVDLADYWDHLLFDAVQESVEATNRNISFTLKYNHVPLLRQAYLSCLQSPSWLTWRVRRQLPSAPGAILGLEVKAYVTARPPKGSGKSAAHFASPLTGIYSHAPLVPDPRQLGRTTFMRSSMIKVHDTYMGTDKVGHFVGMGFLYYMQYLGARSFGLTQDQAIAQAVRIGRHGPISETWLVGEVPTGVYSNADMAANYVGMKYYINITEPVRLQGATEPAMVVRQGDFWRIQPHVRPDSGYFAIFVSSHFDEVLNPNMYEASMRSRIRKRIRSRANQIVDRYAQNDPAKRSPEYFQTVLKDCLTYYGEDYGHCGKVDKLIAVSDTCFQPELHAAHPQPGPDVRVINSVWSRTASTPRP
jgi:hypothetical protein